MRVDCGTGIAIPRDMHDVDSMFPPASRWCDVRCQRCVLSDECADGQRLLHARLSRGSTTAPVEASSKPTLSARALPTGPISLARFRLDRSGKLYAHGLARLEAALPGGCIGLVLYEIGEVSRVPPGDARCAPNVLLLERLLDDLAMELSGVATSQATVALRRSEEELRRALAPWTTALEPAQRRALHALVSARRAPSPFCTTERPCPTRG